MPTARETQAQKLERLEAENVRLAQELADARVAAEAQAAQAAQVTTPVVVAAKPKRRPGRTIASVAILVIATIIAPVALISNAAVRQFLDTEEFVSTLAPLVEDPLVQEFLIDEITDAINENVDIAGITNDLFDGLETLSLPPRALDALDLLRAPAVTGIQGLITTVVTDVVTSEQFEDVVAQSLRLTHEQLILTLQGDPSAAIVIDGNGTVGVQLGPIIAEVKARLLDRGIQLANAIPEVDRTIVIAQSDDLAQLTAFYSAALGIGTWLIWIDLLLFALAVIIAKRRSVALVAAGLCLAGVSGIVAIALAVGRFFTAGALTPAVPIGAAEAIYDALVTEVAQTALVLVVLGLSVAIVASLAAPWGWSRGLRASADRLADGTRESIERRGVTTGRFGEFLARWRVTIRIAIGVIAAAIIIFVRPLTPGLIIWTAVLALLLVVIFRLLERPVVVPTQVAAPMTS
jgi:hypothetical protein